MVGSFWYPVCTGPEWISLRWTDRADVVFRRCSDEQRRGTSGIAGTAEHFL